MKKYKMLNFFDEYDKKYISINKLAILSMVLFILLNLSVNIIKLKEVGVETNCDKTENIYDEDTESTKEESVDLDQIKFIYSILGESNIEEITILKDNVQIYGKCSDLRILDNIKNMDTVKNTSLDSINKEEDYYTFKLKYQTR